MHRTHLFLLLGLFLLVSSKRTEFKDLFNGASGDDAEVIQTLLTSQYYTLMAKAQSGFRESDHLHWTVSLSSYYSYSRGSAYFWMMSESEYNLWKNGSSVYIGKAPPSDIYRVYSNSTDSLTFNYEWDNATTSAYYVIAMNVGHPDTFTFTFTFTWDKDRPIDWPWAAAVCAGIIAIFAFIYLLSRCFMCTCSTRRVPPEHRRRLAPNENRVPVYVYVGTPRIILRHFLYDYLHPIVRLVGSKPAFGYTVHYANTHDILWIWSPFYNETHPLGWRLFSTLIFILWILVTQNFWIKSILNKVDHNVSEDARPWDIIAEAGVLGFLWKILVVDVSLGMFRALHRPILRKITWKPSEMMWANSPKRHLVWFGRALTLLLTLAVSAFICYAFLMTVQLVHGDTAALGLIGATTVGVIFLRGIFPGIFVNLLLYYMKAAYGKDIDFTSDRIYFPKGVPQCDDPFCSSQPYFDYSKIKRRQGGIILAPPHMAPYHATYGAFNTSPPPGGSPNQGYGHIQSSPPSQQVSPLSLHSSQHPSPQHQEQQPNRVESPSADGESRPREQSPRPNGESQPQSPQPVDLQPVQPNVSPVPQNPPQPQVPPQLHPGPQFHALPHNYAPVQTYVGPQPYPAPYPQGRGHVVQPYVAPMGYRNAPQRLQPAGRGWPQRQGWPQQGGGWPQIHHTEMNPQQGPPMQVYPQQGPHVQVNLQAAPHAQLNSPAVVPNEQREREMTSTADLDDPIRDEEDHIVDVDEMTEESGREERGEDEERPLLRSRNVNVPETIKPTINVSAKSVD